MYHHLIHFNSKYVRTHPSKVNAKAVGIIRRGSSPVRKHTIDTNLLPEDIKQLENVAVTLNNTLNGTVVIVAVFGNNGHGWRALQRPGNNLETQLLGLLRVDAGHDLALLGGHEVWQRGCNDLHAVLNVAGQVGCCVGGGGRRVARLVEENSLLAEFGLGLDPVQNIGVEEALGPDVRWRDAGCLVVVNQLLRVLLLRVVALKRHLNDGGLELRCVLETKSLGQLNVLLVGHDSTASGVQVGSPAGCSVKVVLRIGSRSVEAVHLAAKGLELLESDIARAALGLRRFAVGRRLERCSALGIQLWDGNNVGGSVQVALAVAANKLAVLGEGDVAFENTSSHASTCQVRLPGLLGELERGTATMANGPRRLLHLHVLAG